ICTALSRKAAQEKETPDINATLELEDLVVTPIKTSSEKILTRIESTDATVKFCWSEEISHEYRRNKIEKDEKKIFLDSSKGPELDDEVTWKTEKDEKSEIERKDRIIVSASKPRKICSECREGRVEDDESNNKIVAKIKEMNSTSYSGDGIEKTDEFKTYHSSSQGTAGRDNEGAVEDDDYADNDKMMVEEDAEIAIDEKGLAIMKLDRAYGSLCENVDGKVSIVKRGLLNDDSNIKKETGKNKIEGNDKGNLDVQAGLGSCYRKGGLKEMWKELAVKENKEEADKSNRGEHTGRIFNVDNTNRIYETKLKIKIKALRWDSWCQVGIEVRVDDRKNENGAVNKDAEDEPEDDSGETIADDEEKNGIINMLDRRKSDQTKDKNSGIIPAKTCDKRDGSDDIKTVGINDKSNRCNTFVHCQTVARTGDANMTECDYQDEIGVKENKTFTGNLQSAENGNIIARTNPGGRYSVSPFKDKKTRLEGNLDPTEGGCPGTKGLEYNRPDRIDIDVCSTNIKLMAVNEFEDKSVNIGNESNSSDGIISVNKIKSEGDKERRIVSNNRKYQTSDEKIDDLPELSREVQGIECADKWWSGSVAKLSEISNIREDSKRIDYIPYSTLEEVFSRKRKKTKLESRINSYLSTITS
ncbi:39412_t:CDS:2, partial [Gigaspora margarita]